MEPERSLALSQANEYNSGRQNQFLCESIVMSPRLRTRQKQNNSEHIRIHYKLSVFDTRMELETDINQGTRVES